MNADAVEWTQHYEMYQIKQLKGNRFYTADISLLYLTKMKKTRNPTEFEATCRQCAYCSYNDVDSRAKASRQTPACSAQIRHSDLNMMCVCTCSQKNHHVTSIFTSNTKEYPSLSLSELLCWVLRDIQKHMPQWSKGLKFIVHFNVHCTFLKNPNNCICAFGVLRGWSKKGQNIRKE